MAAWSLFIMPLTFGKQACAVLHLLFLVLEDLTLGESKCYHWGINHIRSSEGDGNQSSSLPDYSSPCWVPSNKPKMSLFPGRHFPSSSSSWSPLRVPRSLFLFPAAVCSSQWSEALVQVAMLCVLQVLQREGRSWRKLAIVRCSESITGGYFVKRLSLFPLHFKDPLLSGFVARFLTRDDFAPSPRKGMWQESKSFLPCFCSIKLNPPQN